MRITPRENGQKCGVSRRAVNAVENNTHAPALSLAFSLARELQIRYLP
ncbi:MAG: helix-turn-helix domain-containing protein [Oscillospiraceae bacterium]|nr:helix-turn-helix domain-containing protein [Oscillospiraceae bacterium]